MCNIIYLMQYMYDDSKVHVFLFAPSLLVFHMYRSSRNTTNNKTTAKERPTTTGDWMSAFGTEDTTLELV